MTLTERNQCKAQVESREPEHIWQALRLAKLSGVQYIFFLGKGVKIKPSNAQGSILVGLGRGTGKQTSVCHVPGKCPTHDYESST